MKTLWEDYWLLDYSYILNRFVLFSEAGAQCVPVMNSLRMNGSFKKAGIKNETAKMAPWLPLGRPAACFFDHNIFHDKAVHVAFQKTGDRVLRAANDRLAF